MGSIPAATQNTKATARVALYFGGGGGSLPVFALASANPLWQRRACSTKPCIRPASRAFVPRNFDQKQKSHHKGDFVVFGGAAGIEYGVDKRFQSHRLMFTAIVTTIWWRCIFALMSLVLTGKIFSREGKMKMTAMCKRNKWLQF